MHHPDPTPEQQARIDVARALHLPNTQTTHCTHCMNEWPCPTAIKLRRLGG
jgi:hypothetical protein